MKKRRLLWAVPPLVLILVMVCFVLAPDRESRTVKQFETDRERLAQLAERVLDQGSAEGIIPPAPWQSAALYNSGVAAVEFSMGSCGLGSETYYWGVNYVPSDSHMVGFQGQQWDYWKEHKSGRLYYDPEGDNTCYVKKLDACWYYYEMEF